MAQGKSKRTNNEYGNFIEGSQNKTGVLEKVKGGIFWIGMVKEKKNFWEIKD